MKAYLPPGFSFAPYAQICSLIFLFSPIPLFIDIFRTKNIEKLPNLQYPSLAIMQLGWCIYGLVGENLAIFRSSAIALAAQTIYSTLTFVLQKKKIRIVVLYSILLALTLIYRELSAVTLGTLVCLVQIASSATNFELLFTSVKERNGGYYNFTSVLMCIPAGLLWGLYGIEVMDWAVILPSVFDLLVFSLQLICILVFPAKKKEEKEKTTKEE